MDDDAGEQALNGPFAAVLCPLVSQILALQDRATYGMNGAEHLDAIRAVERVKAAADSTYLRLLPICRPGPRRSLVLLLGRSRRRS
jgi:hypothetical protein